VKTAGTQSLTGADRKTETTDPEGYSMLVASKHLWRGCWLLVAAVLASALLAVSLRPREASTARPAVPLDDWDIARLVAHLNSKGLRLRMVATGRNGVIDQTAFLTTTNKGWQDFNHLTRDEDQISQWQGTLYCTQGLGRNAVAELTRQWGDRCLVVGPFLFYGDRELLERVRAALT
jgi:hypothetical protein